MSAENVEMLLGKIIERQDNQSKTLHDIKDDLKALPCPIHGESIATLIEWKGSCETKIERRFTVKLGLIVAFVGLAGAIIGGLLGALL